MPKIRRLAGQLHQLVGVEVEVGGLPAVDQHGLPGAAIGVPDQPLPDGPVELAAHLPEAAGRADQSRLRRGERLAGGQGVAEVVGVNAQNQAGVFKLAALHTRLEIAAIEQHSPVADAVVFVRVLVAEDHKGVVLVAGGAPDAAHALDPGAQRGPVQAALHDVAAVKGDEVQVGTGKVQTQGGTPAQAHGLGPGVDHPHTAGDQVVLLKHTVVQLGLHLGRSVLQKQHQGLAPLPVEGGQAL
jgi:hypothetical protein